MQHPTPHDKHSSNPYASPASNAPPQMPQYQQVVDTGAIWRDGPILIMHKMALLPDACIKSNEKTDGYRLKRNLTWHHPAIALTLLISPVIYIIIAAVVSKRATIHIGLSDRWRRKRRNRILIGWASFLGGIAMFIGGIAIMENRVSEELGLAVLFGGITLSIVGGLYGLLSARLIKPNQIDDLYVRIKGVHPEYLAQFPQVGMPQPNAPVQS